MTMGDWSSDVCSSDLSHPYMTTGKTVALTRRTFVDKVMSLLFNMLSRLRATSLYFSLSCIGEGNGNPLQCSCLENPRDGGAWWAAVYGVAQSRTRLKRLSSSSSSRLVMANLPVKLVAHYHSLELYFVLQVSGEYWLRAQILKSDYLDLNPNSATYQPWDPW